MVRSEVSVLGSVSPFDILLVVAVVLYIAMYLWNGGPR